MKTGWTSPSIGMALCLCLGVLACKDREAVPPPAPDLPGIPRTEQAPEPPKEVTIKLVSAGSREVVLAVNFPEPVDLAAAAGTLRKRLEDAGARSTQVQPDPPDGLRVAVTGIASPEMVQLLAGFQGRLQVVPVDEKSRILELAYQELPEVDADRIQLIRQTGLSAVLDSKEPDRLEKVAQRIADKVHAQDRAIGIMRQGDRAVALVLVTDPILDNSDVEGVSIARDQKNRYRTLLDLKPSAGGRFADYTGAHLGERLAIVLDDNVLFVPVIGERIDGGRIAVSIHWDDDPDRARMQARVQAFLLSMEPLPARPEVTLIEDR